MAPSKKKTKPKTASKAASKTAKKAHKLAAPSKAAKSTKSAPHSLAKKPALAKKMAKPVKLPVAKPVAKKAAHKPVPAPKAQPFLKAQPSLNANVDAKLNLKKGSAKKEKAVTPVVASQKAPTIPVIAPQIEAEVKAPLLRKPNKVSKNEVLKTKSVRSGRASMPVCRETACDSSPVGAGYCRLHYIKNWKQVKNRELILKDGTLNRFIEELVTKYPEKTIDALMNDLRSEVEFAKAVIELALEDPGSAGSDDFDSDDEIAEPIIDTIKKETFDEFEQF